MDEFKMSAFGCYPDGSSDDAFAEVSARSLVACFGAMAAEVADWLPQALACGEEARPPQAIELTLEWSGTPTSAPASDGPRAPSDPARRNAGQSHSSGLRCAARHRLCCTPSTRPLRVGARGGLLGARA